MVCYFIYGWVSVEKKNNTKTSCHNHIASRKVDLLLSVQWANSQIHGRYFTFYSGPGAGESFPNQEQQCKFLDNIY